MTIETDDQTGQTDPAEGDPIDDDTDPTDDTEGTDADDTDSDDQGAGPATKLRRQAAKYRTQLRQSEGQVVALTARVEAYQRADVLRQAAAEGMLDPGDFFAGGTQMSELLDDDGEVDASSVRKAIGSLRASKPYLFDARSMHGGARTGPGRQATWGDAFANANPSAFRK